MTPARAVTMPKTETDIAVLQVKVDNIEEKVGEIKSDIRELRDSLEEQNVNQMKMIKELHESNSSSHKAIADKVSALEKWRWMMMGAGIVLGTLGYDTVAKLLK